MSDGILPGLEGYAKRDAKLGQWDTHPEVCAAFATWSRVRPTDIVLEPCVGIGNLAKAIELLVPYVQGVEIDVERAEVASQRLGRKVIVADFLSKQNIEGVTFDLATMNPPYENDGESKFIERGLVFAPRVTAIVRLVALASERRAPFWRSVDVTRIAHLTPRPVFAGSSGMDEIIFIEVERRVAPGVTSNPTIEWLDWRPGAQQGKAA